VQNYFFPEFGVKVARKILEVDFAHPEFIEVKSWLGLASLFVAVIAFQRLSEVDDTKCC
jgi:hypothetical protein